MGNIYRRAVFYQCAFFKKCENVVNQMLKDVKIHSITKTQLESLNIFKRLDNFYTKQKHVNISISKHS